MILKTVFSYALAYMYVVLQAGTSSMMTALFLRFLDLPLRFMRWMNDPLTVAIVSRLDDLPSGMLCFHSLFCLLYTFMLRFNV